MEAEEDVGPIAHRYLPPRALRLPGPARCLTHVVGSATRDGCQHLPGERELDLDSFTGTAGCDPRGQ